MQKSNVPVLIFSAGLADIIEEVGLMSLVVSHDSEFLELYTSNLLSFMPWRIGGRKHFYLGLIFGGFLSGAETETS